MTLGMRLRLSPAFLALCIGIFSSSARSAAAAEPYADAFQVNRFAHTTGSSIWVDADTGSNGDTAIIWPGGNGGSGIYMQRFDAAGRILQSQDWLMGPGVPINAVQRIAVAGNGSFAIARDLPDGSGLGVFVTIYDRSGNVIVPERRVNDTTAGDQLVRSLSMNAAGQVLVTFVGVSAVTGLQQVCAKRFQPNGAAITSELTVYVSTVSDDRIGNVDAGIDAVGNFVVTWWNGNPFGAGGDVYARRYSFNGAAGPIFRVNTYLDFTQEAAQIAVNGDGSFVVVWSSASTSGKIVAGRRYDAGGTALGDEFQISQGITNTIEGLDVHASPGGGFVVAWHQQTTNTIIAQIMARSYGADGAPLEAEMQVNQTSNAFPIACHVGVDRDGNIAVSWLEQHYTANRPQNVEARRYAPAGISSQPIASAQVVTPIAGATNSWRYFKLSVPLGRTTLDVAISGGVGDADMYIRYGALPTLGGWDVRPYLTGNNESVRITNIPPGTWYIGIQGFSTYGSVSLQATAF